MFRPSFNRGSVLKQNMLESLRDYPHTILSVHYFDYGEGIISGFNIRPVGSDGFIISPGILKINDSVVISPEDIMIEQFTEQHFVYIEIENCDNPDGVDVLVTLTQTETPDENRLELFRYTKNAEMFCYRDINELFNMPMNRIDQRMCKFSMYGGSSLHPYYYKLFAQEILKCKNASCYDIAFAYQCLNGIKEFTLIENYFEGADSNTIIIEKMRQKIDCLRKSDNRLEEKPKAVEAPRKMVIS